MQRKVLIVEDSKTSMNLMRSLIAKAQLQPICTTSLVEAKHVFSSSAPEEYLCAVVDFNLPDAPNGEAIDFAIESFLPTIVITGSLDESTRTTILNKRVVDYIPKENAQVYEYLTRLLSRLDKNKKVGVLVVDDSRVSRQSMTALLRRHNFITFEAASAEQGMESLRSHSNIRLAIIDENIPVMSGIQMISELRKTYSKEDLGIIGISSDTTSGLSARFIKSGATDYLYKPYCHEEFFCRIMQNVERLENIATIRRVSNSDYLTGLPNRRHFFTRVAANLKVTPKSQSLAIIDIDHFKKVNDTYGHDCGDYTLKELAKLVAEYFTDYTAARFGGEEFCVYFSNTAPEKVLQIMEGFRKAIANKVLTFEKQSLSCTVSIGLTHKSRGGINAMIRLADQHLYIAKNNGRNQLVDD
ncbi:GGDEF domain-containing response regulator [Paraglaciecola psychrophila]|jgi:diguanylate cyclase (GGDEF)-like protein|uniref:diguanylate cyclase n=1 Tax=Paraglaciecola psychrophila 170 TaxID=1129794 RepID=K7A6U0_9ALTE|nr:diguanylate cyclase [Paraglaciecola psychrophila]AGH47356.1 diguanylate cyclase [Paraglaciecola psychrophila 170]GAC36513.1 response regulator containing GGDEF domain [Paraglaciecola psychrophila 170]